MPCKTQGEKIMIFLEDLMSRPDFGEALNNLIPEYREKFSLPEIHQLGLVVADVEEAARHLEEQGVAPFFIATGSPAFWIEREKKRFFRGKLGFSHHHGVELELLESGEGSDFYRRSLDPEGRIVVQHLGFLVDDVDAWAEKLTAAGSAVWVRGAITLGPANTQFAYMDTEEKTGIVIEFISQRCFGMRWWPLGAVFKVAARLEKWTGKRSISV
jgi:catechol 2,3-dioxygenase-like lactoylglutathione lyase family enzyme